MTSPSPTSNYRNTTEKAASPLLFSFSNIVNQAQSLFPDWKEDQSTQVFVPRPFTLPTFHDKTAVLLLKENAITSCIAWTHSKGGKILHFRTKEDVAIVVGRKSLSLHLGSTLHRFELQAVAPNAKGLVLFTLTVLKC